MATRRASVVSPVPTIQNWPPKSPQPNELAPPGPPLKNELARGCGWVVGVLIEVILCAVALCFIGIQTPSIFGKVALANDGLDPVLAGIALWLKDHPTGDSLGDAMEEVTRLGPTIYPIIFAALLSRSLKNIGRFYAQRGVRLMSLWTLMSTNSLADPFAHLLKIPQSLLVWVLLVLWAMSPLGGQGSLRLLYRTNSTAIETLELRYADFGALGNAFAATSYDFSQDGAWPLSIRDAYFASLMQNSSTKASPLDQWQNVKIPRMDAIQHLGTDPEGWVTTKHITAVEEYSSLLGIPILGLSYLQNQADLEFSVETSYVELDCPSVNFVDSGDYLRGLNITCLDCEDDDFQPARQAALLGPPAPELTPSQQENGYYTNARRLQFESGDSAGYSQAVCKATQRHVEALIECISGHCSAIKVRTSRTDERGGSFTSFDLWATHVLEMISESSGRDWGSVVISGVSSSELFLKDPMGPPVQRPQASMEGYISLYKVDPKAFSARASMLLNTGIEIFMAPTGFAGNLPTNLTLYGPNHIPADGLLAFGNASEWQSPAGNPPLALIHFANENPPFVAAGTNATVTRYTEVYRPDYPWVIILIVSAALLFIVGVIGTSLRIVTAVPNVFDAVVGLTYSNPYMPGVSHQPPLDADDRVKEFGGAMVRIGQVSTGGFTSGVAFGHIDKVDPLWGKH